MVVTLSMDCPRCGMKDTLVNIPKHRNGIQGKQCGMCKEIFFKKISTYDHGSSSSKGVTESWEDTQGNRMGLDDFEGI